MSLSVQVLLEVLIMFTLTSIRLEGILMTLPVTHCAWKQCDAPRESRSPAFEKNTQS